jgi:rhamnosyltransferase
MTVTSVKWRAKSVFKYIEYMKKRFHAYVAWKGPRGEPRVIRAMEGTAPDPSQPLCIFSSYDRESIVRGCVFFYVEALAAAGFDVVFVSTSHSILASDERRLLASCSMVALRENAGYDFYSWKTGLSLCPDYARRRGLLLANDSVFGPFFDVSNLIRDLEDSKADVVGMTDSLRYRPHLQSYFLYFKQRVLSSREFSSFFDHMKVRYYKGTIIRECEVGLSRRLERRFSLDAMYGWARISPNAQRGDRPPDWTSSTTHRWRDLIVDFRFPFLKRSLIRNGKVSFEEARAALSEAGSPYSPELLGQ